MSTYIYLHCAEHDERASEESGQHLYDLPQLRFDWLNRKHWLAYIKMFPDTLTREWDHLSYFQRHTFGFLCEHAECTRMYVESEYGEFFSLHASTVEEIFDQKGAYDLEEINAGDPEGSSRPVAADR